MTVKFEVGKTYRAEDVWGGIHKIEITGRTAKTVNIDGSERKTRITGGFSDVEFIEVKTRGLPFFFMADGSEIYDGLDYVKAEARGLAY